MNSVWFTSFWQLAHKVKKKNNLNLSGRTQKRDNFHSTLWVVRTSLESQSSTEMWSRAALVGQIYSTIYNYHCVYSAIFGGQQSTQMQTNTPVSAVTFKSPPEHMYAQAHAPLMLPWAQSHTHTCPSRCCFGLVPRFVARRRPRVCIHVWINTHSLAEVCISRNWVLVAYGLQCAWASVGTEGGHILGNTLRLGQVHMQYTVVLWEYTVQQQQTRGDVERADAHRRLFGFFFSWHAWHGALRLLAYVETQSNTLWIHGAGRTDVGGLTQGICSCTA